MFYLEVEKVAQEAAVLRAPGVGEALFGHDSVLLDEVDEHVPLTAILGWVTGQVEDEPPVRGLSTPCGLHIRVEHEVQTLNLLGRFKF